MAQAPLGRWQGIDVFGFDPFDDHALAVGQTAVAQRFAQALVSVLELNVLAHHSNAHFALRILENFEHGQPAAQIARRRFQMQQAQNLFVQSFGGQRHGNFIDVAHVRRGNNAGFGHVAEKRDFGFQIDIQLHGRCGKSKYPAEFRC